MLGFAVLDRQPDSDELAVWLITRVTATAVNTNAVQVNLAEDPDALRKVHALTRGRAVLLTEGSTVDGLPVIAKPLTVDDLGRLAAETDAHQHRIVEAIDDYARRTRNHALVRPTFPPAMLPPRGQPDEDTPTGRALHTANHLARVWTRWLVSEEERRSRSVNPRTNSSPWIMPMDMASPVVAQLPGAFRDSLYVQPTEPYGA